MRKRLAATSALPKLRQMNPDSSGQISHYLPAVTGSAFGVRASSHRFFILSTPFGFIWHRERSRNSFKQLPEDWPYSRSLQIATRRSWRAANRQDTFTTRLKDAGPAWDEAWALGSYVVRSLRIESSFHRPRVRACGSGACTFRCGR